MKKWFYVLELTGGRYYVGISNDFVRRSRQHHEGIGAVWTQLHPPIGVLFQHQHEVADNKAAELIENEMTVRLMEEHGWRNVRGGYFCTIDDDQVEQALRAHGHWDRALRSSIQATNAPDDWLLAVEEAHQLARSFHEEGCTEEAREAVLSCLMGLRRHRYWRPEFDPGLEERFWGARGVLRVLLTLQADRVIGFRLTYPYEVLRSGMQMGSLEKQPWSHLFLAAWDAYCPTATPAQDRWIAAHRNRPLEHSPDRRYDAITSIFFPELRWRLNDIDAGSVSSSTIAPMSRPIGGD